MKSYRMDYLVSGVFHSILFVEFIRMYCYNLFVFNVVKFSITMTMPPLFNYCQWTFLSFPVFDYQAYCCYKYCHTSLLQCICTHCCGIVTTSEQNPQILEMNVFRRQQIKLHHLPLWLSSLPFYSPFHSSSTSEIQLESKACVNEKITK